MAIGRPEAAQGGSQPTRCYAPHPNFTGRCQWQPRGEATQSGWYFDRDLNFQETGFLDAPQRLPSGSVRAIDIGEIRLMIAEVDREGGAA